MASEVTNAENDVTYDQNNSLDASLSSLHISIFLFHAHWKYRKGLFFICPSLFIQRVFIEHLLPAGHGAGGTWQTRYSPCSYRAYVLL